MLAIYCKADKFIYDLDQIIQGQFYKKKQKRLTRYIYRDRRSYVKFCQEYQAILIGSRTTIFYQAIYVEAVQPSVLKLLNWKPYNHFLSSYLHGSRTTISSQAIKLEAVQPFLFLSSYLVEIRITVKNQAISSEAV